MNIFTIETVQFHRNGSAAEPFVSGIVRANKRWLGGAKGARFLVTAFYDYSNPNVELLSCSLFSVIALDKDGTPNIGLSLSGDLFAEELAVPLQQAVIEAQAGVLAQHLVSA